jgi:hypothetical protein
MEKARMTAHLEDRSFAEVWAAILINLAIQSKSQIPNSKPQIRNPKFQIRISDFGFGNRDADEK